MVETQGMSSRQWVRKPVLLAVTAGVTVLFIVMVWDFLVTMLLAAILAGMSQPAYRAFLRWARGRRTVASVLTLSFFSLVVLIPATALTSVVAAQAVQLTKTVTPFVRGLLEDPHAITQFLRELPFYEQLLPFRDDLVAKVGEVVEGLGGVALFAVSGATKGTFSFFLQTFILLYAMFFFLKDGHAVLERVLYYLPLPDEDEERLIERFVSVARATLKGTIIIGILQGSLAGMALGLAGIPNWVFWGAVMAVLSVIPGVGSGLVWVPAVIYLIASGEVLVGAVVAGFCAGVVGSVDNVLRPMLVGNDAKMHDLLILLGTLGGLLLFGVPGVMIGPIVAALFVTVWEIYGEAFSDLLPPVDRPDPADAIRRSHGVFEGETVSSETDPRGPGGPSPSFEASAPEPATEHAPRREE